MAHDPSIAVHEGCKYNMVVSLLGRAIVLSPTEKTQTMKTIIQIMKTIILMTYIKMKLKIKIFIIIH